MKKTFILENLDCANCAAKLERSLNKMDGVEAVVTFMTKKMVLEAEENRMEEAVSEAQRIIKKLEPQVVVKARGR
ncbi:MAG: heavy metal transporter [Clostridiales bacterium]|jgi:copper chaperone CopZ|nr:heavy metal transporter [Clostridiales bacterium]